MADVSRNGLPWTARESEELVTRYWQGVSTAVIAASLQRTPGAVRARLGRLGQVRHRYVRLTGLAHSGERWTAAESSQLLDMVEDGKTNFEIAVVLGRSRAAVTTQLMNLGGRDLRGSAFCKSPVCENPVVQNATGGGNRRKYCSVRCQRHGYYLSTERPKRRAARDDAR